jgi:phosphomevalonate kinase
VLVYSERRVLLAGGWFVLREKYCWLVADKPSEQGLTLNKEYRCSMILFRG